MDGLDHFAGLEDARARRAACVEDITRLGREKAEANRRYLVAKARAEILYRDAGLPASIAIDQAVAHQDRNPDRDVSWLGFERECAEVAYWANKEALDMAKDDVKWHEEAIRRGWESC